MLHNGVNVVHWASLFIILFTEVNCVSLWFTEVRCVSCGSSWFHCGTLRLLVNQWPIVYKVDCISLLFTMVALWFIDVFVKNNIISLWFTMIIIVAHRGSPCIILIQLVHCVLLYFTMITLLTEVFFMPLLLTMTSLRFRSTYFSVYHCCLWVPLCTIVVDWYYCGSWGPLCISFWFT